MYAIEIHLWNFIAIGNKLIWEDIDVVKRKDKNSIHGWLKGATEK